MSDEVRRISRRGFMQGAAAMVAATGVTAGIPGPFADAMTAPRRRGTLDDVEHVVILMQENRSFDHYYGTMRGVRGFSDRAALSLAGGNSVLYQPDPKRKDGGYLLPFHVDTHKVDGQDMGDLLHDWDTTHTAWAHGDYDDWVTAKGEMTMAYFERADIPFHRALAEAYTVCDNYHCSIMGPTTPNRLYLWTGTIDPAGTAGGPATWNPSDYQPVYSWTTYPERLQEAGVSWQVYANDEVGDSSSYPYAGDYGDNPLWLFQAYHDALASSDPKVHQLAERGGLVKTWKPYSGRGLHVEHVIAKFRRACALGTLPSVSWVVAPYGYSEHPAARPVDGQAYVAGVLDAIWNNPDLRDSTVVILDYDENDGFFDHVPPPVPPHGTPDEFLPAIQPIYDGEPPPSGPPTPIGLGPRVPMTVISPWSRGGWVNSQVYDHTSLLRFLEVWTGVSEPNISAWRREVCGDLTGCFDFASPNTTIPLLPDTTALRRRVDRIDPGLPAPSTPAAGAQVVPTQEPGRARARPLPYQPLANFSVRTTGLRFRVRNSGTVAFPITVHSMSTGPAVDVRNFDVTSQRGANGTISLVPATGAYDVWIYGPNGFLSHAAGDAESTTSAVEVDVRLVGSSSRPRLRVAISNSGTSAATVQIRSLDGSVQSVTVDPGASHASPVDPIAEDHGWYDLTFTLEGNSTYERRYAGHLENGRPSATG